MRSLKKKTVVKEVKSSKKALYRLVSFILFTLHFMHPSQVANFILENSGQKDRLLPTASQQPLAGDPFTGSGRYIPGSSGGGAAGGVDPFTG